MSNNQKGDSKLLSFAFQSVDCGWEGGPRDAEEDVHPPGQPGYWGAVDAEGGTSNYHTF